MTIRVGIAGLGKMGLVYRNELLKNPSFELAAIYDINPVKTQEIDVLKYTKKVYSLDDFVSSDFQLGIITSVTGTHAQIAVPLLNHKKDVLTEKPLDQTLEQADQMIIAGVRNNHKLMVGYVEHFNPVIGIVSENLYKIGQVKNIYIERKRPKLENTRQVGSNVIHDCLVHDIYNLLGWVNDPLKVISAEECKLGNKHMPYLDYGKGHLLAGSAKILFEVSWVEPDFKRITVIEGDKGHIYIDYLREEVEINTNDKKITIKSQNKTSNIQLILEAVRRTLEENYLFPIDLGRSRSALEIVLEIEKLVKK
ncbi:Gfo/Idh/MocA family oxidoreductase [Candidatus Woesearchaeota archaeon]|nr:Gfo/Idh/MocA family oxidoreductase [Candidatus Woesearchaeota archaeon]